jgi:hypothetical protein
MLKSIGIAVVHGDGYNIRYFKNANTLRFNCLAIILFYFKKRYDDSSIVAS